MKNSIIILMAIIPCLFIGKKSFAASFMKFETLNDHPSNSLSNAITTVAEQIFDWNEEEAKKQWLRSTLNQVNNLEYTYCLANQIYAINSVKDQLFDWDEEKERNQWVRRQIDDIIRSPNYDCTIADRIHKVVSQKEKLFDWNEEREARSWARREVAALL